MTPARQRSQLWVHFFLPRLTLIVLPTLILSGVLGQAPGLRRRVLFPHRAREGFVHWTPVVLPDLSVGEPATQCGPSFLCGRPTPYGTFCSKHMHLSCSSTIRLMPIPPRFCSIVPNKVALHLRLFLFLPPLPHALLLPPLLYPFTFLSPFCSLWLPLLPQVLFLQN